MNKLLNKPLSETSKIFFDDDRQDMDDWTTMRTSPQLLYFLTHNDKSIPVDILSMDHDIGNDNLS